MKNLAAKELVGKYINRVLFSDVYPVGKVVGYRGKTIILIQPIEASKNKTKMDFHAGGFAANCSNQDEQMYSFLEKGEVYEARISKSTFKNMYWSIEDKPRKFYDFNF